MPDLLLRTTVVGSYPQPDWLVDRASLAKGVPRVRMRQIWRVPVDVIEEAQDDATILAIRAMEGAGIDIITDGEMRRESYSNYFATALEGVDADHPAVITNQTGTPVMVPRVTGRITRAGSIGGRDLQFLRANTDRAVKVTIPGPFTLAQQASNEFYPDIEAMAMDFALAVNAEVRELEAAGADVIQLDEPWLRNDPEAAERFAVRVIDQALEGITVPTVVHLCFGYAAVVHGQKPTGYTFLPQLADSIAGGVSIESAQPKLDLGVLADLSGKQVLLGVLDLGDPTVEPAEVVATRIRAGLQYVSADRLVPAPDCGMKYLPRGTAYGKLQSLSAGAAIVRRELAG